MYIITKTLEISAAHALCLDYESKCQSIHGHNWILEITCQSERLNANGMVIDFTEIKRRVHDVLDHKNLNDVLPCNPTAENIARWICEQVPFCVKVTVQESQGNSATYEKNDISPE
jgi:6-pyruvoyltetrahydropterin/6-carboxytetrahydropterin synthase